MTRTTPTPIEPKSMVIGTVDTPASLLQGPLNSLLTSTHVCLGLVSLLCIEDVLDEHVNVGF